MAKENLQELIKDAWLGVDFSQHAIIKPLDIIKHESVEEVYQRLIWLMSQPEYLAFTVKILMNIELLPFQAVILAELWQRKFPMLIASRGAGKSWILSVYAILRAILLPGRKITIVGSAFRQSKILFDYVEGIWNTSPILRSICDNKSGPRRDPDMCRMVINNSRITALPIGDGCLSPCTLITYADSIGRLLDSFSSIKLIWGNGDFRETEYFIDNGLKPTKIVSTKKGYSYEGTYNHAMKVVRSNQIKWVRTEDMKIGDRILIDRSERWHGGSTDLSIDEGYALGLLIGDGSLSNEYRIGFATKDLELAYSVKKLIDLSPFEGKTLNQMLPNDPDHWTCNSKDIVKWFHDRYQIVGERSGDKEFPKTVLGSTKEIVAKFISGLYASDGHCFVTEAKGGVSISVNFTSTSERLIKQLQYVLLHFGIVSTLSNRERNIRWNTAYELGIYGLDVKKFAERIGFGLKRKQDQLMEAISRRTKWVSVSDSVPIDPELVISSLQKHDKPDGMTPSILRRLKSLQHSFLKECMKYSVGASWHNLVDDNVFYDEITSITDSECHTYDIHVPNGNEYCANGFFSHNSKIRGQRSQDILADEFGSIPIDIFENVIAGFAAVSAAPADNVRTIASKKKAEQLGIALNRENQIISKTNQIIISGTAYYDFNHFAKYWKKWSEIVNSGGERNKLKDIFNGEIPKDFDYSDYSVIRIPYNALPDGFMDDGQISRSKATIHSGIFNMEFLSIFSKDSMGFFKRSLLERCTPKYNEPLVLETGEEIIFEPSLIGEHGVQYVLGCDPASEVDNFSLTLLALYPSHRRIKYVWTTTRKAFIELRKNGQIDQDDFYGFCARKIRDLMKTFSIVRLGIDSQGGGVAVYEALHDKKRLKDGELPLWTVIDLDKPDAHAGESGLHIIELINFANFTWLSESNHGLRFDFENRKLLFPAFDPISIGLSEEEDAINNRKYDTLSDVIFELEELKAELSIIQITQTPSGRDHWDTPSVKTGVGRVGRLRKDRYSSLLIANSLARNLNKNQPLNYESYGGFSKSNSRPTNNEKMFIGPAWWTEAMQNVY